MSTTSSPQSRHPRPELAPPRASRCEPAGSCAWCADADAYAAARGDDAPVLARAAALAATQRSRFAAHVASDFDGPSSLGAHASQSGTADAAHEGRS